MDYTRYHALKLAIDAGRAGGTMTTVLNAANEAAVALFLQEKIGFLTIDELIERAMDEHTNYFKSRFRNNSSCRCKNKKISSEHGKMKRCESINS